MSIYYNIIFTHIYFYDIVIKARTGFTVSNISWVWLVLYFIFVALVLSEVFCLLAFKESFVGNMVFIFRAMLVEYGFSKNVKILRRMVDKSYSSAEIARSRLEEYLYNDENNRDPDVVQDLKRVFVYELTRYAKFYGMLKRLEAEKE